MEIGPHVGATLPAASIARGDLERASPEALKDAFEALLVGELLTPLEQSLRRSGLFPDGSAGDVYAYFWKQHMSSLLAGAMELLPGWDAPVAEGGEIPAASAPNATGAGPLMLQRSPGGEIDLQVGKGWLAAPERSPLISASRLSVSPELRRSVAPAADATGQQPELAGAAAGSAPTPATSAPATGPLARLAPFETAIQEAARAAEIGVNWVRAVIIQESGGRSDAVSSKGAQGLMQLIPSTAAALGVKNAFDPVENIQAGTRYLAGLVRRFGDMRLALAAYNAGPSRVAAYGGLPPFRETQQYVARVMQLKETFDRSGEAVRQMAAER